MSSNPLSTGDSEKEEDRREHERRHREATDQAERIAHEAIEREKQSALGNTPETHNVDDLIVAQTEAVGQLAIGITKFAEQYNVAEESRKKDRRVYLVLIGCILLIALIVGVGVVRINQLQTITTDNSEIIRDCVQPIGQCYIDNQKRTADTVARIGDANRNGVIDTEEILKAIQEGRVSVQ